MLDMHGVIGSIPIVSTTTQTHYLEYFSKGLFSKIWRISKEIRHIFLHWRTHTQRLQGKLINHSYTHNGVSFYFMNGNLTKFHSEYLQTAKNGV